MVSRFKQYEYRANSNLVLMAERSGPRPADDDAGEVQSLRGRDLSRMGDRAQRSKPPGFRDPEKLAKLKERAMENMEGDLQTLKKAKKQKESVLSVKIDDRFYKPKTRETKAVYEQLLNELMAMVGDQPSSVIAACADEILYLLKDENMREQEKKTKVMDLVNSPSEAAYTKIYQLSKRITDFVDASEDTKDDEGATEMNLAFVDEESEDENEYVVRDEESDEDSDAEMDETGQEVSIRKTRLDADDDVEMEDENLLDPSKIDAFWIQREVSKFQPDKIEAQRLSGEILSTLRQQTGVVDCENELVNCLGFDHFDFIKVLLYNRSRIAYCTLLKQAQTDEERDNIRQEMQSVPELAKLLDILDGKHRKGGKKSVGSTLEREAKLFQRQQYAKSDTAARGTGEGANNLRLLDLDSLSFGQGGHLMSNKKCVLPPNSRRLECKGYDEVHIPGVRRSQGQDILVRIDDLPEWARVAFPKGVHSLNPVQSKVFKTAFYGSENMLVCAPTGAGKTYCALLTMLHEIGLNRDKDTGEIDVNAFKIVYIAPMKSLVREMVASFSDRLSVFGMTVRELSGDVNLSKQQISETQVIVTTPEKWDIVTRKTGDRSFTQLCRLVIIDEIHLLHDDRGPVIESIVARTIRQVEDTQEMVRLVGLSATLPNYEDVATFCRVKKENILAFDNSYRPIPLEQQYIGITERKALKRFQLMNEITYEKVMDCAGKHQVIVFVHSRKETVKTAKMLRDMAMSNEQIGLFLQDRRASREILQHQADDESLSSADLKDLLPYGFAVHHAGLSRYDRHIVEDLFDDEHVQVLVSTATLAWGVNLPAHTVIIKGTQVYNPEKGTWMELSSMDVLQMLGRAGRPGRGTKGEGVLITTHAELQYYLSLMNQQLPIESQFLNRLVDNLNAEIVMGTVHNAKEAAEWLSYTYLNICMLRSPTLYGVSLDEYERDPELEQRRLELIHSAATVLDKNNLIKYDRRTGNFQVTNLGRVSSHYYISHSSIHTYNEHLKASLSDIDLFRLFSLSEEFKYITVRQEEKPELEKLLTMVPIPVKETVDEPIAKVNVLLQVFISQLKLDGFALAADMVYVTQSAGRIMRALFEIVLNRGWAQVAEKTLTMSKMISRRMWSSQSPLRQFGDIPPAIIKRIEGSNMPFDRLYDLNSQEIGELISFKSQGKAVFRRVHQFPRLDVQAQVQPITPTLLKVDLTILADFEWSYDIHGSSEGFWVFVEDVDGEKILYHEFFILKRKYASDEHYLTLTVELFEPMPPQYFIRVVSDRWLGSETVLPITFKDLILPARYQPPTELLDLQPIPISSLGQNPLTSWYKKHNIERMNAIQTQVHHSLYKTDESVLVAAPTSSGKSLCAEMAILRELNKRQGGEGGGEKIVYVAMEDVANERYFDWEVKFEGMMEVVQLTGELNVDMQLLASGELIVATPEQWDMLSRRWKQRKHVRAVTLFIADELHLISSDDGPTLEVVISRMRYIASETEKPIRIVALASSIANAKSVGQWIGASNKNTFNFHPHARPVPLEVHLKGFKESHFDFRFSAMTRPVLSALTSEANGKPVIIFVPSRTHMFGIADEIRAYCESSPHPRQFLKIPMEELEPHVAPLLERNKFLRELLQYGVAVFHEHMSELEKAIVEKIYVAGAVQVLVATRSMCWAMGHLSSYLTVVMGAEYFDGQYHRYVDYPVPDVLQMVGRASRPGKDSIGKCIFMCHQPKKDYYKKFLFDPLPVESHLDLMLAEHMNAEIYSKTIQDKQDGVDFLTWTFFYQRLTQNPNYYNMHGVTHRHVSDHLSELIESTVRLLEDAGCVSVDADDSESETVTSLNLGMVSAFYYIKYSTIEVFASSLTAKTKLKGLIEILSSALEYEDLPIRHKEAKLLTKLAGHLPVKITASKFNDPFVKANILLQAHFSRLRLPVELRADQKKVLKKSLKLIQAMVDVINSSGWLKPALDAMELSQMVVQGMWSYEPILKQLPHFSDDLIERCREADVTRIEDIADLEDEERSRLLKDLSVAQMADVAKVCNQYPDVDVQFEVQDKENLICGEEVNVVVRLEQDLDEDEEVEFVHAPYYPKPQLAQWWIVIGDTKNNQLYANKRIALKSASTTVKLSFTAPNRNGAHNLTLSVMNDSYIGADQEYPFNISLSGAIEGEEEDSVQKDADGDVNMG